MSNEVTLIQPRYVSLFPTDSEWLALKDQATTVVKSGLLPSAIKTAEQAIAIALKGRELGIPVMQAFAHIHIIQGKPTISAELMLSLIFRNCPGAVVDYVETDDLRCVIQAKRPNGSAVRFSFSMEDAKKAGLLSKDSWSKYPGAMLRARAIAIMARALFPDAINGCSYTPEELGADLDDDGCVIDVVPQSATQPIQKPIPAPAPGSVSAATPGRQVIRSREVIYKEIVAQGAAMNLGQNEVVEWAAEWANKPPKDMTTKEMDAFLEHLKHEAGRNGIGVA
jgi:hypothetical protein